MSCKRTCKYYKTGSTVPGKRNTKRAQQARKKKKDYRTEYNKTEEATKKRSELVRLNREYQKKGLGKVGDGKDVSHKLGGKTTLEPASKNRGGKTMPGDKRARGRKKMQMGGVIKRRGSLLQHDGRESTHLMAREYIPGKGWVAFPTLFQNEDNSWLDLSKESSWEPAYEEARKRGEVYEFGDDEEKAIEFADKGSWKTNSLKRGGQINPWLNKEYGGIFQEEECLPCQQKKMQMGGMAQRQSSLPRSEYQGTSGKRNTKDNDDLYNELIEILNTANDSVIGDIIKIIDPTGVTSYKDVYDAWTDGNLDWRDFIEPLGALPVIGKVGKVIKVGSNVIDITKIAQKDAKLAAKLEKLSKGTSFLDPRIPGIDTKMRNVTGAGVKNIFNVKSTRGAAKVNNIGTGVNLVNRGADAFMPIVDRSITQEQKEKPVLDPRNIMLDTAVPIRERTPEQQLFDNLSGKNKKQMRKGGQVNSYFQNKFEEVFAPQEYQDGGIIGYFKDKVRVVRDTIEDIVTKGVETYNILDFNKETNSLKKAIEQENTPQEVVKNEEEEKGIFTQLVDFVKENVSLTGEVDDKKYAVRINKEPRKVKQDNSDKKTSDGKKMVDWDKKREEIKDINKMAFTDMINKFHKDKAEQVKGGEYEVRPGDSISKIANKLSVSPQQIIEDNNLENPDLIVPGQKIKVKNFKNQYLIVDKKAATMSLYRDGEEIETFVVGVGANPGDAQTVTRYIDRDGDGRITEADKPFEVDWSKGNYSTGAGVFTVSNVTPSHKQYYGLPAFNLKNSNDIEVATAIHGTPYERRSKIVDGDPTTNRVSYGCVNGQCEDLVTLYEKYNLTVGDKVYILPEDEGNIFKIQDDKVILRSTKENRKSYETYIDQNGEEQKTKQGINETRVTREYKPIKIEVDMHSLEGRYVKDAKLLSGAAEEKQRKAREKVIKEYVETIEKEKKNIMNQVSIPSDRYNDVAKVAIGILGVETNFGDEHDALTNFVKGVNKKLSKELFDKDTSSPDYKSKYYTYGVNKDTNSVGLTQIKFAWLDEKEKELLEKNKITKKDLVDNPKKAALATMLILAHRSNTQVSDKSKMLELLPKTWNDRRNYSDRVREQMKGFKLYQIEE